MEGRVKIRSPQHISRASQQNSIAATPSWTTEVDQEFVSKNLKSSRIKHEMLKTASSA